MAQDIEIDEDLEEPFDDKYRDEKDDGSDGY